MCKSNGPKPPGDLLRLDSDPESAGSSNIREKNCVIQKVCLRAEETRGHDVELEERWHRDRSCS